MTDDKAMLNSYSFKYQAVKESREVEVNPHKFLSSTLITE